MNPETKFKERVMKDLDDSFGNHAYVLKTQEVSRRGVPDIIICLNGKFFAIELKVDGEKATPLQDHTLHRIRYAGGIAFTTTPSQWDDHFAMMQKHD